MAAAAIALAGSFYSVPALAESGGPDPAPSVSSTAPTTAATPVPGPTADGATSTASAVSAVPAAPGISEAGLAAAVQRDLGLTVEQFNAAGQLGRTAADSVRSLRGLPGYLGISLRDGKILVEGSGPELQARVDELNVAAVVFELVAPVAERPTTPVTPAAELPADPAANQAAQAPARSATAPSKADLVASSTEQLFQEYVREVGATGLQAVAYSGGNFIIRTGGTNTAESALSPQQQTTLQPQTRRASTAAPGKISPADFVARYANVRLEVASPAATEADVYGGDGYVIDAPPWRTVCSTGFGAYSARGLPVVLTAGHCTEDGTGAVLGLEPRTSAPAGGASPLPERLAPFGTFGYSQFGGQGNSWVLNPGWNTGDAGDPGNVGTDIAVVEAVSDAVNLRPAANTWASAANPGATAVKIIGTVAPFKGQNVCRSGRTDGWSCGQVEETGIYVVGGRTTNPADVRAFRGFLSKNVQSSGGDSGGPWISGNFAVGTHSAGEAPPAEGQPAAPNFAIATTLEDSLTKFPSAVELQLFLNKPQLVAAVDGTVMAGQPIVGRIPAAPASAVAAGSKVRIVVGNTKPVVVPVDSAGNWSFPAPGTTGPLRFTAETVNGFSRSGAASLRVTVSDLDAPVISTPAEGAALKELARIDGTGTPGLAVHVTGDISGSAVVAPDGSWSVPTGGPLAGRISVRAVQTSPGVEDSPSVTRTFTVAPAAPQLTSISDGAHLSQDSLPATLSGTGIDGAGIGVVVDGTPANAAQVLVEGGSWRAPFPAGLDAGAHTLSVTQSVDGVGSDPLLVTFSVDAPAVVPAAPGAEPDLPAAVPPAQVPVVPAGSGQLPGNGAGQLADTGAGQLADTGAGSLLPTAGLAGGAILLGAVLLAVTRRRVVR